MYTKLARNQSLSK